MGHVITRKQQQKWNQEELEEEKIDLTQFGEGTQKLQISDNEKVKREGENIRMVVTQISEKQKAREMQFRVLLLGRTEWEILARIKAITEGVDGGTKITVPFSVLIPESFFKYFNFRIETTSINPQNCIIILKPNALSVSNFETETILQFQN